MTLTLDNGKLVNIEERIELVGDEQVLTTVATLGQVSLHLNEYTTYFAIDGKFRLLDPECDFNYDTDPDWLKAHKELSELLDMDMYDFQDQVIEHLC